jgi:hypothetical protein
MLRKVVATLVLGIAVASPCFGQEWARNMFKVVEHEFGSVAAGGKAEYRFVFENIYLEDVHVAGVRTSCGCTTPSVETPQVKTYEQGTILAHFNTDSFRGQRGATLTVTIDKPYYAEVQLQVRGYIRSDVVVEPGSVQFGSIDQGIGFMQTAAINYTGHSDWQVVGVKSANPHITAAAVETGRSYGQVSYQLKVVVDKSTPAGYLNDQLMLLTNDASGRQIPVLVEGRVIPSISVSPPSLVMGVVQSGQKVTKQLVVKGKVPFRITEISCNDKSFKFDTSKEGTPKEVHLIPVTFTAGADTGKVARTIRIKTDQGQMTPELPAYYAVVSATK